jgi:hypothetical protein
MGAGAGWAVTSTWRLGLARTSAGRCVPDMPVVIPIHPCATQPACGDFATHDSHPHPRTPPELLAFPTNTQNKRRRKDVEMEHKLRIRGSVNWPCHAKPQPLVASRVKGVSSL